ncbi:MAG TPA: nuclear transport factor 2 family protein [Kofleriaceae bacterium]|nr:nuclear transport factor 2 family protein [Kofleriaceae bacterium]
MSAPVSASRPPPRALLRIAGLFTQLLCAGCLLLGTIAFVLVQQNKTGGSGFVILWASTALIGLVFGGLMGRGGLISLVICGVLDAALGVVLIAFEYGTLRALLKILPESDVATIATIVTAVGVSLLGAFALCLLAIPQSIRYTRWMHEETAPRLAQSTVRGFPPPPVPATPRESVWRLPIVGRDEARTRRRLYFVLAGFALGLGTGVGVLVSSSAAPRAPAAAAPAPGGRSGSDAAETAGAAGSTGAAGSAKAAADPATGATAVAAADGSAEAAAGGSAGSAGGGSAAAQPERDAAAGAQGEPVTALIQAQRAALAKGDLGAVGKLLAPGVFGFGIDADEVAEGKDLVELLLRKDVGALVQGGATVELRYSAAGEASAHAWIALELEISGPGRSARRFAVTELAARTGDAWTIVAWHWAAPVADKAAERMAVLGTKPVPKAISSALTGPASLEAAVRAALGSRRGFAAARSEHEDAFNFGSGPSERIVGGAAIKRVFEKLRAEIRLHDGLRVVASSAWDPAQKDAPAVAFAAANVDFRTKTRAATELTHTFRLLAILIREGDAWKIVQTQWSHGGPIR